MVSSTSTSTSTVELLPLSVIDNPSVCVTGSVYHRSQTSHHYSRGLRVRAGRYREGTRALWVQFLLVRTEMTIFSSLFCFFRPSPTTSRQQTTTREKNQTGNYTVPQQVRSSSSGGAPAPSASSFKVLCNVCRHCWWKMSCMVLMFWRSQWSQRALDVRTKLSRSPGEQRDLKRAAATFIC